MTKLDACLHGVQGSRSTDGPSQARPYIAFGTPDFASEEVEAVTRVLRSGWVGMGPETIAFERELSAYVEAPEVVSVNSCTSALFLALLAEGIGEADEVIVPSLTWCASVNAALYLRATPVFCDVERESLCVSVDSVLAKLSPRTRAVVVVHYGGFAVDVSRLREALPHGIAIVEDAAHAIGARYPNGNRVGSSGNLVCFSFYANKNLSTADGGAIALFDGEKAAHLRSLRMNGLDSNAWSRYVDPATAFVAGIVELGYKMNFTDLQAALGRVQLRRLDAMAVTRKRLAERYRSRLASAGIAVPFQAGAFDPAHARHLLVGHFGPELTGMGRDQLLLALRKVNVGASIHYRPLHIQPFYRDRYPAGPLPVTESLADRIMTLPISARMTADEVDYVVDMLAGAIGRKTGIVLNQAAAGMQEFDFGGRLAAAFPSHVIMDITEVCNLACVHCPHPTFSKSEHYAGRHLDPALNEKMVEEVRRHGAGHTQYIRYTSNGEPLAHPQAYDMIEAAVRHSGVYVTLTTNGKILNEKRIQRLLEAGVHMIDISIDAFKADTYAKIRVNGSLEVTRGNVLKLLRWVRESGAKTKVVVSFVEQPQNREEMGDFERYWKDQGADYVVIRRLHSCSGAVAPLADMRRKDVARASRRPCLYPWERIVVNARGDLAFCPSDWVHGSVVADYRYTTIREEWQGAYYQALRRAHLTNDYTRHGFCGQCPDWAATRWPHQGRSYADMVEEFIGQDDAPRAS